MSVLAYLGLGSNLGDKRQQVKSAIASIAKWPKTRLRCYSDLIQTKPFGPVQQQPDFINAVIAIETALSPHELLTACLALEQQHGRERVQAMGPRSLDVDILLYGQLVYHDDQLTIPHPGLTQRRFVLEPLQQIAPELILPDGRALSDLLTVLA